ncbi:MAG: efflux RND transporter periplasmic adaptor subunit [Pseudorhodobacter sp.]
MFKRLVIAVLLLGAVVGSIVWFKYFRDGMIQEFLAGMTPPPVPVNTVTVEPVTWQPSIEAVGTTRAAQGVELAIEVGGPVREILFKANDEVELGQVLLKIDDDGERASLAAAQADLVVAQNDQERAETLAQRGVSAATTLSNAVARTEGARAQVAQVQTILDAKELDAPFAGVIGIAQVDVGQYVAPGQIYATLQDLSQMRVDFTVPEQQIKLVQLGGMVEVATEVDGFSAPGQIIAVEPRVDPNSRLVTVRAEVENNEGQIFPGQFLRVKILLPEEENVIALPQTAVSSSLYGDFIYVLRGEEEELTAEQIFVQAGRRSGGLIELREGAVAGDRVVTSGQNRLSNGAKVKIDNSVSLDVQAEE